MRNLNQHQVHHWAEMASVKCLRISCYIHTGELVKRSSGEERVWHRPDHASSLTLLYPSSPKVIYRAERFRSIPTFAEMHMLYSQIKTSRVFYPFLRKKAEQRTYSLKKKKKSSFGSRNTNGMTLYTVLYVLINFDRLCLSQGFPGSSAGGSIPDSIVKYCNLHQPAIIIPLLLASDTMTSSLLPTPTPNYSITDEETPRKQSRSDFSPFLP